jgi:ribosomal-protein-alanine N-acetyltransferase
MNDIPPFLNTSRLTIRLAHAEDIPAILAYYERNREHLTPWWPQWAPDFFTHDYWQRQIERDTEGFQNDTSVRQFLFLTDQPDRVVGIGNANNILRGPAQNCSLGYALDHQEEGKGLMTEALEAVITYLFEKKNLHRVQAAYVPHNRRSGAVLRRLGFVVDGYARDYVFINGRWEDHVLTSRINPNW